MTEGRGRMMRLDSVQVGQEVFINLADDLEVWGKVTGRRLAEGRRARTHVILLLTMPSGRMICTTVPRDDRVRVRGKGA
jgi:hypothetical protein